MKYERLTEYQYQCNECEKRICKYNQPCAEEKICKVYNRLADLEDKIENGTLFELPCKVGDTVFAIVGKVVEEFEVYFIKILTNKIKLVNDDYIGFVLNDEVFLTKAEAEQRLKELEE